VQRIQKDHAQRGRQCEEESVDKQALNTRQEPFRLNALKLAPPTAATQAINRDAVCSLICGSPATLALLSAPAGFGKTTSMSQAYRELKERQSPVAWLTLDPADNDLGRLGMYASAAFRTIFAELSIDPSALDGLRGDFSAANSRIYRLLEEIPLIHTPFVLFFDEFEHITDPEVLGFVNRLLAVLDTGQRLVIGSRRHTNLQLGRLRVQGRLLELGTDALRFSEAETRRFVCDRMQSEIADGELQNLHGRTEGWPAALQLATMAARLGTPGARTLPKQLSGSIADYLAEDVLDRLPQDQRTFLLRSSIFEMFCPAMCDEVFETTDSEAWIAKTTAENLFLNKIDADGDWYRYHPLFHEFLQRECGLAYRGEARTLHARAAEWLADAGRTSAAIVHALAAEDHELAAELIEQCAMRHVRTGQLKAVCQWLELLPEACLLAHPEIMIAGAYANTYLHKYGAAGKLVVKLDAAKPSTRAIADDLLLVKIMLAAWTDDIGGAFDIALAHQERLETDDPYVIGLIHNVVAYSHGFRGYYFFAHQSVAAAKRAFLPISALHGLAYSTWLEGSLSLVQGDASDAHSRAAASLNQIVNAGHKYSSASPVAAATLLEVLYEMNDLNSIGPLADDYLSLIRETCLPDQIIISHRVVARVHALRHQQTQALEILNILHDLGDARNIPRFSAAARLDRIWMASLAGDFSTVGRLLPLVTAESIWKPFDGLWTFAEDIDDPQIAAFRYALVSGDAAGITGQIETAVREAEAANRRRRVLRLQCLLAQSHELARRRQRALEVLERALGIAQSLGLVRIFVDESWCLVPLLEALSLRSSTVAPDYLFKILDLARHKPTTAASAQLAGDAAAESSLSPREQQILSMLAEGCSNKELATRVLVAESTIETYLHRINTKLGTRNRTHAVTRGRELGLIS
jgi:LuxR family maltose regulon positive regulatory protein